MSEVFVWRDGFVLKRFRSGITHQQCALEFHNARAAYEAGLPTPKPIEQTESDGQPAIVFQAVAGMTLLQHVLANPSEAKSAGQGLARLHMELHQKSSTTLPRQYERLGAKIRKAMGIDAEQKNELLELLSALKVDSNFCHGDFHPGNIMMTQSGLQILDWYDASSGSAVADIAKTLLLMCKGEVTAKKTDQENSTIKQCRHELLLGYRNTYAAARTLEIRASNDWIVLVAAARLADDISTTEREEMQQLVREALVLKQRTE